MNDCMFFGKHVAVRIIAKRNGKVAFALYRPYGSNPVLDEFNDRDYANKVAEWIDSHGGSYDSKNRRMAKDLASLDE